MSSKLAGPRKENLIKAVGGKEKQSDLLVQILTQLQNWWQQACLEQGEKWGREALISRGLVKVSL